jgi:hypothetical protein
MNSFFNTVEAPDVTKSDVLDCLHIGKSGAVRSDIIGKKLGIDDKKTNVQVRKMILELLDDGYLIGSCGKGYYFIDSWEELQENIDSLGGRAEGLYRRMHLLKRNWERNKDYIQITLRL